MVVKGVPVQMKVKLFLAIIFILAFASNCAQAKNASESKFALLYKYLVQKNEYEQTQVIHEQKDESKMIEWNSKMLQQIESMGDIVTEETPKNQTTVAKEEYGWYKAMAGIGYSFLFIFLSEVGDKTFLFIVLYATKMNPVKLLIVSSLGICTMHVLGVLVGDVFQYFLSPFWIKLVTVVSFFIFGVVLIYMGITEEPDTEDIDTKLKVLEEEMEGNQYHLMEDGKDEEEARNDIEGKLDKPHQENWYSMKNLGKAILFNESMKVILTIFATEMGDRSQISAVGLAAVYDFWTVALAGSAGHILAMFLAIVFGRVISNYTSEKCINLAGGILFLIFSAYSILVYYVLEEENE